MKGFGTVVTGTLIGGRIAAEDQLVLQPCGRTVKVRGLQVHGERRLHAVAGQRVAVNLAGVEVADVARGETLTAPDGVTVSRRVDVQIEVLPSAKPIRHGARVRFHQGTRELLGRVALTGATPVAAGAAAFARLHLERAAALVRGDRFILRAYSPPTTIAGGTVLDPLPPRRGVRTPAGMARFTAVSTTASTATAVTQMIEEAGLCGLPETQLGARAGVRGGERAEVMAQLAGRAVRIDGVLVSAPRLAAVEEAMLAAIHQYHADYPLEEGMPREELRERLFGGAPVAVFEEALRRLVTRGRLVARDRVALAGRKVALSEEETRARDAIAQALNAAGLAPPGNHGARREHRRRRRDARAHRQPAHPGRRAGADRQSALPRRGAGPSESGDPLAAGDIGARHARRGDLQGPLPRQPEVRHPVAGVSRSRAHHPARRRQEACAVRWRDDVIAQTPIVKDLVLIGGGHSHIAVLKRFGMTPLPGVRLTLISRGVDTPYSGMLPGVVAGHYLHEEAHIDLEVLARSANALAIFEEATGLDLDDRRVQLRGRPSISYDLLSIDIGSTPSVKVPGSLAHAVPVKPIDRFLSHWDAMRERLRAATTRTRVAVVGGGAGGVELILAVEYRMRTLFEQEGRTPPAFDTTCSPGS